MGGTGILLQIFFQDKIFTEIFFNQPKPFLIQLLIGLIYGFLAAKLLSILLKHKMFVATKKFFGGMIKKFRINVIDILFVSFCAGVGEELLFRGAIQTWLGIWLSNLLFIALHGYLNPNNKAMFIYGVVLYFASIPFGYFIIHVGFWAAASAHFMVDVVLLMYLKRISKIY